MTSGGPQIPESPPKKPPTTATPVSTRRRCRGGKRGRQPASWLAPKATTATPERSPNSTRSGSATHQLRRERDHHHQHQVHPPEVAHALPGRPDAVAQRLEEVRDQHRHDQQRHRHLVGHERARDAQRDQRQREADHALGEAARREAPAPHRHAARAPYSREERCPSPIIAPPLRRARAARNANKVATVARIAGLAPLN